MTTLDDYRRRYDFLTMRRKSGVLEVRFRDADADGSMAWDQHVHQELPMAFADIGNDPSTRVVILTGTGDEFIDRMAPVRVDLPPDLPQTGWSHHDRLAWEGDRLLRNLLDIEVPIIAAVNGPARVHAELALLSDIVLASDGAVFGDVAHLARGVVPGDGVHVVWPFLLGAALGRQALWTGREFGAQEAAALGLVAEVVPSDQLLDRAWEHARRLAELPRLTTRYTRALLVRPVKRALLEDLTLGLAMEGIGVAAAKAETRA